VTTYTKEYVPQVAPYNPPSYEPAALRYPPQPIYEQPIIYQDGPQTAYGR
jgi:hypothetical protein